MALTLNKTRGQAVTRDDWLNRNVVLMSLSSLFSDASHEAATAILPLFLQMIGAGSAALGIIEGAADAASSVLKFLSGHYSDRIGRRKEIAIAGYSLTALGSAGYAFVASSLSVLGLRVLAWMGRGGRGPVRDAMLADSVTAQTYGRAFGLHRAMDTIGAVVGPAFALLLVPHVHLRTVFLLTLIPGMLAVFFIAAVREPRRPPSSLRMRQSFKQLPPAFKIFLYSVGVFGLGNFAHTLLILRAADILKPAYGARANTMAIALYALHNVLYAAVSFPAGRLGDRFSRRSLLVAGYALFFAVALGFGFATSLRQLVALFIGAGIYIGIVDAVEASYAAELLPFHVCGHGFGILGLVNGAGDFLSSAIVGWLWAAESAEVAFVYAAGFALAGAGMLFMSDSKTAG